jgi:hypothetical protein
MDRQPTENIFLLQSQHTGSPKCAKVCFATIHDNNGCGIRRPKIKLKKTTRVGRLISFASTKIENEWEKVF